LLIIAQFVFFHHNYHRNQEKKLKTFNHFFQNFHTERTQNFVNYSTICFSSSKLSLRSKKSLKKLKKSQARSRFELGSSRWKSLVLTNTNTKLVKRAEKNAKIFSGEANNAKKNHNALKKKVKKVKKKN
jgi:hypothetical protein